MKTKLMISVLSSFLLVGCGETKRPVPDAAPVPQLRLLIAGQSNSVGAADGIDPQYSRTGMVTISDVYHGYGFRIPTEDNPMDSGVQWIIMGDLLNRPVFINNTGSASTTSRQWRYANLYKKFTVPLSNERYDALLWIQGESDTVKGIPEQESYENLVWLIEKSRELQPGIPWFVALTSGVQANPSDNPVRRAQLRVINEGLAMMGPDLDIIRSDISLHPVPTANDLVGLGLVEHGERWFEIIKEWSKQ